MPLLKFRLHGTMPLLKDLMMVCVGRGENEEGGTYGVTRRFRDISDPSSSRTVGGQFISSLRRQSILGASSFHHNLAQKHVQLIARPCVMIFDVSGQISDISNASTYACSSLKSLRSRTDDRQSPDHPAHEPIATSSPLHVRS